MQPPVTVFVARRIHTMDPAHAAHAAGVIRELGALGVAVVLVLAIVATQRLFNL